MNAFLASVLGLAGVVGVGFVARMLGTRAADGAAPAAPAGGAPTDNANVVAFPLLPLGVRGRALPTSSELTAGGRIAMSPANLAVRASIAVGRDVSAEAYALACMLASEGEDDRTVAQKQARAWVALNDARYFHTWSLLYTICGPTGLLGPQRGWRYASGRQPYEGDLAVAEAVLSGRLPDNTDRAGKFVDIDSFGVQAGSGSYAGTVASWANEGWHPYEIPDTKPTFRIFRKA